MRTLVLISVLAIGASAQTSRGYLTTPGELTSIANKAAANTAPYASSVLSVKNYANTGSISVAASTKNAAYWPFGTTYGTSCPQGDADTPNWLGTSAGGGGGRVTFAKVIVWRLTGDTDYANDAIVRLRAAYGSSATTSDWDGEVYGGNNQCILNLAHYIPDYVMAADLLEGYSGWTSADKTNMVNWLSGIIYKRISWADELSKNNWGSSASAAAAAISDYVYTSGHLLTTWHNTTITPLVGWNNSKQNWLDRANGNSRMTMLNCAVVGIRPDGGIPDELARGTPGCNGLFIAGPYPACGGSDDNYTWVTLSGMTQQAELFLRRGDSSLYDHIQPDNSGSITRAYLFSVANPNTLANSCDAPGGGGYTKSPLEWLYRYTKIKGSPNATFYGELTTSGAAPAANGTGPRFIGGVNNRMAPFGTLLAGFATNESPSLPPTASIGAAGGGGNSSFIQSNNCPTTLTPSSSCTITVFFQPQTSGTQTSTLSVASSAAGSPVQAALSGIGLVPATLTLSPSTVNFGNVVVNSTSTATAITLSNAGGSAATISSIVASTHFTQTNNCPASLAGGASCVISVTSTPVATGVLNGTLSVAASATGSPFVANLSVNGVAPVAVLAPSSINFGNQPNGSFSAPQSFSLSNTGTSTLTFTISKVGTNPGDFVVTTQCAGSLAPGASCPITVVFEPTTTGARSATVRITDNASGSPHDAAVSGTGIATAPAVCLSVNSVNFGNQPVSTSSGTQPVVVTNCGTANLVISAVTPTGNFSSTGCVTTVAVNATCTINGTFTPASAGAKTGQFSIASNAASSPDLVTLSGFGTQTGATLTSTAAFGHVVVGVTSPTIPLTLTNTGNTSLNLNTPTITGTNPGDFSFGTSCGSTLAPNATCQLSATFTPTTTGARSATLTQSFTGGPTSVTSALSGTGDAATPAVTLTPATLDFGSVTTGVTSAAKTVQIQNSGNAILNINSITLTGTNAADYARTNNCGATLAAGAVCTVDITVTPGGTGARTANLHLIDDAADTPQNVTMTTNGVASPAPKVSLSPASLSFSPPSIQTTTTSAAQNITATNTGNANLVVSAVTLSGTNPGDFTISNNCSTVAAGNTCSATVNCVPTAAGSRTATVSFVSNAASSPDAAAISCTGFVGTPTILLAVTNINFGNQTVGTVSGPATFTLTNTGLATATSVAITTVGDFAVTDNCGGSITQGSSCSATVTFSPLVLCGQFSPSDPTICISNVHLGSVRVVSNTSNSPQTVSLQGTAIPVAPPPGPIIMGVGGKITIGGRLTLN